MAAVLDDVTKIALARAAAESAARLAAETAEKLAQKGIIVAQETLVKIAAENAARIAAGKVALTAEEIAVRAATEAAAKTLAEKGIIVSEETLAKIGAENAARIAAGKIALTAEEIAVRAVSDAVEATTKAISGTAKLAENAGSALTRNLDGKLITNAAGEITNKAEVVGKVTKEFPGINAKELESKLDDLPKLATEGKSSTESAIAWVKENPKTTIGLLTGGAIGLYCIFANKTPGEAIASMGGAIVGEGAKLLNSMADSLGLNGVVSGISTTIKIIIYVGIGIGVLVVFYLLWRYLLSPYVFYPEEDERGDRVVKRKKGPRSSPEGKERKKSVKKRSAE